MHTHKKKKRRKEKKCKFTHDDSTLHFRVDECNLMQLQVILQQDFSLVSPKEKLFHKPHQNHILQKKSIANDQKPQLWCDEMRLNYRVIPGTRDQHMGKSNLLPPPAILLIFQDT